MPSGRTKQRPEQLAPTFFLDRGLGRHLVAGVLRKAGFVALPMADVYPHGQDQVVADEEWIERADAEGWVALTKDSAIIRDHADVLAASSLRVFALSNASLTGPAMAERFRINLNRIVQRARQLGPYVYSVTPTGRRGHVELL